MKVEMREASGVTRVSAQSDGLSNDNLITHFDENTMLGQVGVSRDGAVHMANLYPVRLPFSMLAITKLRANFSNHACAGGRHLRADRHGKVVRVLVGTLVTTTRAVGLSHVIARTCGIRKNIR